MQHDLKNDSAVVAIQPEVGQLATFAKSLVIKTQEGYAAAADRLKTVKGLLKQISDAHARVKKPLLDATRELDKQKNEASAPLLDAESKIKRAMSAYTDELERKRRAEQARIEEAARKEREKLAARAEKAAAAGKLEKAAEIEALAETVVAPVVQIETPKVAGVSSRENWKAECTDLRALVKAVAEGRAPLSYVMANEKVLNAQARSLKSDLVCDGVRVWSERGIASTAA